MPASATHLPPVPPRLRRTPYGSSVSRAGNHHYPLPANRHGLASTYGCTPPRMPSASRPCPNRHTLPPPPGKAPGAFFFPRQKANTASLCGWSPASFFPAAKIGPAPDLQLRCASKENPEGQMTVFLRTCAVVFRPKRAPMQASFTVQ